MEGMAKTWELYGKTKDPALKEKLILEYAPIVKYVAGRLSVHIGTHVEYNDMVSYGIFGLIDAIDKFDPTKGVKFETYASLRIRGSIIDNIRKLDWVPRTLRQKNKQMDQAYANLEVKLNREPTEEELANYLSISVEEIKDLMKKSSVLSLISLDDYLEQNHEASLPNQLVQESDSPEQQYLQQELKQLLIDAIDKLSEKEKTVITLYYFEELTLKEISNVMSVSESRISQIHSKAIMKMQNKLGKYRSLLFSI